MIAGYRLVDRLGRGGAGTVHRVRDASGRELAMKTVDPAASDRVRRRFRREAEALARLDAHPGIVPIHTVGEERGVTFYVMDVVDGPDLAELILEEGPLEVERSIRIARDLARAAHFAHENGIVHRDIKPRNVILGPHGPVLTDFGLARDALDEAALTVEGTMIGTPAFMPPEQANGRVERIGPATDAYAIGATLQACLTGEPPFEIDPAGAGGSPVELVRRVLEGPPRPVERDDVPAGLRDLLDRCLAREPDDRPANAGRLADALDAILHGGRTPSASTSAVRRLRRWWRSAARNRLLRVLLPVGGALAFAAVAFGLFPAVGEGPPPDPAGAADETSDGPVPSSAPSAGPTPIELWLDGEADRAWVLAGRRRAGGEETPLDRLVMARIALERGDLERARRETADAEEPVLRVTAALVEAMDGDRAGIDALRRLRGMARGPAHEALARLHLEAGRPALAAEEADRAARAGGIGARLARRLERRLPEDARSSRPVLRESVPVEAPTAELEEALEQATRDGREEPAVARERVAERVGELGPDAPAIAFRAVAGCDRVHALQWNWAAAERDPLVFLDVLKRVGLWEHTLRGDETFLPLEPGPVPGLPDRIRRTAEAVARYYVRRGGAAADPLCGPYDAIGRAVHERPGSVVPRVLRGLCAHAMGYPGAGRADVEAALALAPRDADRAVVALTAAEGLARTDPGRARELLAVHRRARRNPLYRDVPHLGIHPPEPERVGSLRELLR